MSKHLLQQQPMHGSRLQQQRQTLAVSSQKWRGTTHIYSLLSLRFRRTPVHKVYLLWELYASAGLAMNSETRAQSAPLHLVRSKYGIGYPRMHFVLFFLLFIFGWRRHWEELSICMRWAQLACYPVCDFGLFAPCRLSSCKQRQLWRSKRNENGSYRWGGS